MLPCAPQWLLPRARPCRAALRSELAQTLTGGKPAATDSALHAQPFSASSELGASSLGGSGFGGAFGAMGSIDDAGTGTAGALAGPLDDALGAGLLLPLGSHGSIGSNGSHGSEADAGGRERMAAAAAGAAKISNGHGSNTHAEDGRAASLGSSRDALPLGAPEEAAGVQQPMGPEQL